jgi:amylovoran biosynthesis glycosyltransferase AmsD
MWIESDRMPDDPMSTIMNQVGGRRRVAILINDMNSAGGIQRVAANLVRDLSPRYETMLLSIEPLDSPVFYTPGLDFRSLGHKREVRSRLSLVHDFLVAGRLLRRFVVENRIDTVVGTWYDWSSVMAFALPRSVRRIGCEHMSYFDASAKWRWIRAKSYPRLDAVVALTATDLPLLARISRAAHVISNYMHPVVAAPLEGREKILLTVGHLENRKGIDRLLWALKQPLMDNPDWKLVVVGGGEKGHVDWGYLDYIATLLQILQLDGRVEFYPSTKSIDEWYRRAAIYVLGSRREGLPMVLIEAKAHGLPIIAFDCPTGPKEIIRPGIDGFLISADTEEFAAAAATLIADSRLRHRFGAAAQEDFLQRFSSDSVLPKWFDLIEGLHVDKVAA